MKTTYYENLISFIPVWVCMFGTYIDLITFNQKFPIVAMLIIVQFGLFANEIVEVPTVHQSGGRVFIGPPESISTRRKLHIDEIRLAVTLKSFRIGKYPVTAEQFCVFLNSIRNENTDSLYVFDSDENAVYKYSVIEKKNGVFIARANASNSPANRVTWLGAVKYCKWLSIRTGRKYRLPSEAEWEHAARGNEERLWPWGNSEPDESFGMRWKRKIFDEKEPWLKVQVGSYPKSNTPQGVSDFMTYAIGEWCCNKYYEGIPNEANLTTVISDESDLSTPRVVRGYFEKSVQLGPIDYLLHGPTHEGYTWTRTASHPIEGPLKSARFGFRIVEEVPEVKAPNSVITESDDNEPFSTGLLTIGMLLVGLLIVLVIIRFVKRITV